MPASGILRWTSLLDTITLEVLAMAGLVRILLPAQLRAVS
jgi:hypothetical protein